ncbi:hypothetical protein ACFQ1I_31635 [Kitasatospora arboriphila]
MGRHATARAQHSHHGRSPTMAGRRRNTPDHSAGAGPQAAPAESLLPADYDLAELYGAAAATRTTRTSTTPRCSSRRSRCPPRRSWPPPRWPSR